jgi:hypothetical protein
MQGISRAVFLSENTLKFGMCRNSPVIPFLSPSPNPASLSGQERRRAPRSAATYYLRPAEVNLSAVKSSPSFTSLALPPPPHPTPKFSSYPRWRRSALRCYMLTISATSRCAAGAPSRPPPPPAHDACVQVPSIGHTSLNHYQPCPPPVAGRWSSVAPSLIDAFVACARLSGALSRPMTARPTRPASRQVAGRASSEHHGLSRPLRGVHLCSYVSCPSPPRCVLRLIVSIIGLVISSIAPLLLCSTANKQPCGGGRAPGRMRRSYIKTPCSPPVVC